MAARYCIEGRRSNSEGNQVKKKTIFLTGASGNMGQEGLRQLLERRAHFDIVVLVLPTDKDHQIMAPYADEPGLKIIWGDLTCYEDVLAGVTGADIVLHVGGLVSPAADRMPALTTKVNIGSVRNIIQAIKAQPDPDAVKLVYIGTVAQTGDRNTPVHWGRVGDPIQISVYDNYALSKTIAECEVIESGLRHWVSLRQTGIAHWALTETMNGQDAAITFHQPVNGVFEWVTVRDAGRLLVNVCADDVPDEFWNEIYNIGGGDSCRVVNHEFMAKVASIMGLKDFRAMFEPNWFATRNFHGQWYEDSQVLEDFLHFRKESINDYIAQMRARTPLWRRLLIKCLPASVMKSAMRRVAQGPGGTLHWMAHDDADHIAAYFGSKAEWGAIPGWDEYELQQPCKTPLRLNHGYDERKPRAALDIDDMCQAAQFRGGECLSTAMAEDGFFGKLNWRCAFDHEFAASPMLVLRAGHWCPDCLQPPWRDGDMAARNPFFAQVWHAHHDKAERRVYQFKADVPG
jgi:nucleoside-diphosphate-sugar epimerase